MKIAMVGQFPPHFGGVGVHIHTLSKELVKQGHEVYVITYPHADLADIDGIHVIGTKGINIPGIRGLMFKRNAKKALEKLLKEVDIDIVHGHYLFPAGAAAVEVGSKHKIKTYVTAHGSDMFEMYKKQSFMRPSIKNVLKKADVVFAVSNALKQEISAKLGKVHINLTVKGEQQAKKAVNDVYNAMQKFKSAKGSEKLTAGIDVAIQSIKYKLITLKNTMKENFVSNLINKMSGKAKKASKELAENVPGGAKTIGFFKSSLGKLSLLLGGFGIGSYIKQATDLAIKYEASAMQIQNSLGKASQKIMDFAQNSAAALGISQTDAMTYGNKFSLMVRQFEKDTDNIANTTNALMQAAAITASATGTELSTVMDSFQSALTGSSEAVDQYGLNMKIANLEARLGIDNWNDLTVAQQQFYITQELINQTTANFGNKTLKNTNSMLAQFKAQMSNTSLALGKAFKALLTVVLPYLTAFMKVLENVFNYISTMITSLLSLFGITVDFTSNAASGIEAVGGDVDTSGLDGVSDGMDNVAEGADNAADSVEKMKGSLAG